MVVAFNIWENWKTGRLNKLLKQLVRETVGIQTQIAWLYSKICIFYYASTTPPKVSSTSYSYFCFCLLKLYFPYNVFVLNILKKKGSYFWSGLVLVLKDKPVIFEGFPPPPGFLGCFLNHENCVAITELL